MMKEIEVHEEKNGEWCCKVCGAFTGQNYSKGDLIPAPCLYCNRNDLAIYRLERRIEGLEDLLQEVHSKIHSPPTRELETPGLQEIAKSEASAGGNMCQICTYFVPDFKGGGKCGFHMDYRKKTDSCDKFDGWENNVRP